MCVCVRVLCSSGAERRIHQVKTRQPCVHRSVPGADWGAGADWGEEPVGGGGDSVCVCECAMFVWR